MPVLYSWLRWVESAVRQNPSAFTRYIGSGEAASYRRLPPSEPQGPFMARTPARPDRAVKRIARMMRAVLFCEASASFTSRIPDDYRESVQCPQHAISKESSH